MEAGLSMLAEGHVVLGYPKLPRSSSVLNFGDCKFSPLREMISILSC